MRCSGPGASWADLDHGGGLGAGAVRDRGGRYPRRSAAVGGLALRSGRAAIERSQIQGADGSFRNSRQPSGEYASATTTLASATSAPPRACRLRRVSSERSSSTALSPPRTVKAVGQEPAAATVARTPGLVRDGDGIPRRSVPGSGYPAATGDVRKEARPARRQVIPDGRWGQRRCRASRASCSAVGHRGGPSSRSSPGTPDQQWSLVTGAAEASASGRGNSEASASVRACSSSSQ